MATQLLGGIVTGTGSGPLNPLSWGVQLTGFTVSSLPSDAVVQAIYPVIVLSANAGGGTQAARWDDGSTGPVWSYGHGYGVGFTGFDSGVVCTNEQFSAPALASSVTVAALSSYWIGVSILDTMFGTYSSIISITCCGFAIYYTSATPLIDAAINPPVPVPAGQGLAWALPTSGSVGDGNPTTGNAKVTRQANGLVFSAPFSQPPTPGTPYILASTESSPKTVKIRGIKRSGDQKFTITAIDYDPRVYDIPAPSDLSASLSGGSAGTTATTADPTYPAPATPPTDVLSPGDPGYGGASVPSPAGSYTLSPTVPLSQTNATTVALAATACTLQSDIVLNYAARTFTITDPASTPTWYYVTIADASLTGDSGGSPTLTAYCEASTAKVGAAGYIYLGAVLATHTAGVHSAATPGGWPIPFNIEAAD